MRRLFLFAVLLTIPPATAFAQTAPQPSHLLIQGNIVTPNGIIHGGWLDNL
jgi:hypothetical protein